MEDKHIHKKMHRSHLDRRQAAVSASDAMEPPVFGALRERGSGELHKRAQNVLGNYADYQNALDKMDVNEQMKCLVGVTDPPHSTSTKSKVKRSGTGPGPVPGNAVMTGNTSTQLLGNVNRKERSKKAKELLGKEVSRRPANRAAGKGDTARDIDTTPSRNKKKPVIRASAMGAVAEPFKADTALPSEGSKETHTETSSAPSLTRVASGDQASERPASRSSNSGESAGSIRTKKLKKKKKLPVEGRHGKVANLSFSQQAPEPLKARPEALSLSGRGSGVTRPLSDGDGVGTDGPDTGDVHHMLEELLHPTPLSLVTPIPTPKTSGGPFVFPSLPVGSQGGGDGSWRAQAKPASIPAVHQHKTKKTAGLTEGVQRINRAPPIRRARRRATSAGSSSASNSSSSSSGSSSSGSSSASSSSSSSSSSESDVSDAEGSSEDEVIKKEARIDPSVIFKDEKDEGTRFTLEKLQEITTAPSVAITPLKKTPPHFMRDEMANLSPAKHPLSSSAVSGTVSTQASLGFSSQTSMGFQLMMPDIKKEEDSDSEQSDHFDLGGVANPGQSKARQDKISAGDMTATSQSGWLTQDLPTTQAGWLTQEAVSGPVLKSSRLTALSVQSQTGTPVPALPVSLKKSKKKKRKHEDVEAQSEVSTLKKTRSMEQSAAPVSTSLGQSLFVSSSGTTASVTAVSDGRIGATRDLNAALTASVRPSNVSRVAPMNTMAATPPSPTSSAPLSLMVRIPLSDCKPKPKAKVEPYNVIRPAPQRRSTSEGLGPEQEEGRGGAARDVFSNTARMRMEDFSGRDLQPNRLRTHMGNRWDREERDRRTYGLPSHGGRDFSGSRTNMGEYPTTRGGGVDYPRGDYRGGSGDYSGGRGHMWDYRSQEECWSDGSSIYDGTRMDQQRGSTGLGGGRRGYSSNRMDPESYMQEARRRKKDADKIVTPGLEKAKLYMESVTFFMRHGGAIEEGLGAVPNTAIKRNPYKMYSDTVTMIKYCQAMSGEYKPLLVLCLRCQSALHWRMFLIKQASAASLHKDLQEFFLPSKSKSPFPGGGFSPLPSPASVGSTTSTGSGGGSGSDSSSSSVTVPKHIYSKASDYLAMSSHVYTCLELWKLSESYMEQCREFFLNADRKAGLTVHYYSSIFQVASWVEDILKSV